MLYVKRLSLATVFFFIASNAWSQVELANPQAYDLPFYFIDIVNIRSQNPSKSQAQIYLKVPYDALQFVKINADSFLAKYEVSMIVLENDFQADSRILQRSISVPAFEETNEHGVYDYLKATFELDPGDYKVIIGVVDKETRQTSTHKTKIEVRDFKKSPISISDVLIADSVHVAENGNITTFPHVNLPREKSTRIFGFFQVYTKIRKGQLNVEITVRNARNKKVFEDNRDFTLSENTTPILFEIAEGELLHGKYRLKIKAKIGRDKAELETTFRIYTRGIPLTSMDLKSAIKQLQYIASGKEMKKIEKAPADSQKTAFIAFWKEHDPSPGTEENEIMAEYYRRIAYANEHFGRMGEGWKTDMGMVYIILGEPNDVERDPFNSAYRTSYLSNRSIKASEVWHYYHYNRFFIFIDEIGFGDFRLINPVSINDLMNIPQ